MTVQNNMAWEELRAKLLTPVISIASLRHPHLADWRVIKTMMNDSIFVLGLLYLHSQSELMRIPNSGRVSLDVLFHNLEKIGLQPINTERVELKNEFMFITSHDSFLSFENNESSLLKEKDRLKKYFESKQFSELQEKIGEFFDSHKDFFMAAALGKTPAEPTLNKATAASEIFNPLWLRAQIPDHLKKSLSETFMNEVLADPQLKEDLDELADAFNLAKKVSLKIIFQAHNLIMGDASYGKIASAGIDYDALSALNFAWVKAQMPARIASSLTDEAQARIVGNVYAVEIDAMAETTAPVSDTVAEILRNRIRSKLGMC